MYSVAEVNPLLREKQFTGGGDASCSPAVAPSEPSSRSIRKSDRSTSEEFLLGCTFHVAPALMMTSSSVCKVPLAWIALHPKI